MPTDQHMMLQLVEKSDVGVIGSTEQNTIRQWMVLIEPDMH